MQGVIGSLPCISNLFDFYCSSICTSDHHIRAICHNIQINADCGISACDNAVINYTRK